MTSIKNLDIHSNSDKKNVNDLYNDISSPRGHVKNDPSSSGFESKGSNVKNDPLPYGSVSEKKIKNLIIHNKGKGPSIKNLPK